MKIFLTGNPRCGKSTVLMKIIDILKNRGLKVGGFITPEIRVRGVRIGFKVVDIHSGEEGLLASVDKKTGPQVGKYRVDLHDFERVALTALDFAMKECDVVCVDELGTMELFSREFKEKMGKILELDKPAIVALHRNLVNEYKKYENVIFVTPENREKLPENVIDLLGL